MEDSVLAETGTAGIQVAKANLSSLSTWRYESSPLLPATLNEVLVSQVSSSTSSHVGQSRQAYSRTGWDKIPPPKTTVRTCPKAPIDLNRPAHPQSLDSQTRETNPAIVRHPNHCRPRLTKLGKQALEPEWEARFEASSYGFRPGRSCHDAIQAIYKAIWQKPKYVLDADIAQCFDRINQPALLAKLNTCPTIRRQIRAWLKAGVMEGEQLFRTETGTPQGGVFLPCWRILPCTGWSSIYTNDFLNPKGR